MQIDADACEECTVDVTRISDVVTSLCDDHWEGEPAGCFYRASKLREAATAMPPGKDRAAAEARSRAGFDAACKGGDARACWMVAQGLETRALDLWSHAHPHQVDAAPADWMKSLAASERAKWSAAIGTVCSSTDVLPEVRRRACARPELTTPGSGFGGARPSAPAGSSTDPDGTAACMARCGARNDACVRGCGSSDVQCQSRCVSAPCRCNCLDGLRHLRGLQHQRALAGDLLLAHLER